MKKISNILLFTFLLCLGGLQFACTDNMEDRNVDESGKVMVRVQFSARDGETSILPPEQINPNESKIRSIRLYAFDGDILDNMVYEEKTFTGAATVNIEVSTGNKTFYAVVNEPKDAQIHSALAHANHPNGIQQVQYQITNYLNSNRGKLANVLNKTGDYVLPMYGVHSTPVSETTPGISMTVDRAVARVDVYMKKAEGVTSTATTDDATLEVKYPSQTGYIASDNVASTKRDSTYTLDSSVGGELTANFEKIYSFYVPEQTCPTTADRLRFTVGAIKWDGLNTNYDPFILGNDASNSEGILLTKIERNKVYQIKCNMHPKTKDININVKILPWNAVDPQDSTLHPGKLGMTNCYIVAPGRSVSIPVTNVYKIWNWEFKQTLDPKKEVKAEVVWEDTQGLITGVTVLKNNADNSYSKIQVKTAPGKSGNAVVGMWIKDDADKTYRWSWHIWVTDRSAKAVDVEGTMTMTCNLGEIVSVFNVNDARIGLLYQWGRKDPLPGAQGWFMPTPSTLYGRVTGIEFKNVTEDNNLINSIEHPFIFFTSATGKNDWYTLNGTQNNNLWNTADNQKSIFDPCPEGWRVQNNRTSWDRLNSTNFSVNRPNYSRIYLPANLSYPMGGNYDFIGNLNAPSQNGHYWSSIIDDVSAMEFNFNAGLVGVLPAARAAGHNIRCIKE